jgi:hypothetical protein
LIHDFREHHHVLPLPGASFSLTRDLPDERIFTEALSVSAAASSDNGRIYEELRELNQRLFLKVY